MARVAETYILGAQDAMYHIRMTRTRDTGIWRRKSKAIAYNSELHVSSPSNFHCRIFAQPRSISRRHHNALCMRLFGGATEHGRGAISQSSHMCPRDLEAWLFISSSHYAQEHFKPYQQGCTCHPIYDVRVFYLHSIKDLLYSINRWVEDMHTYTLPSHISHHAGDNNNANKSYPTKIIQFQPRGYEKHENLQ